MRLLLLVPFLVSAIVGHAAETNWLSSLNLANMRQSWGEPQVDRSINKTPLIICGKKFARGVGTHAYSALWIDLAGGSEKFSAAVGIDDSAKGAGSAIFRIFSDGKKVWESGLMKRGDAAKDVEVKLAGTKTLLLIVDGGGDGVRYDNADWADARLLSTGATPRTISAPHEERVILTPKPPQQPRINGPVIYGCRPGHPFIYRVPTTGVRPIQFAADSLPDGLKIDANTGIITGKISQRGEYEVILRALNDYGGSMRELKIVCGDKLALTPPMGWNDWYAHYNRITGEMMREAADFLVDSGMADAGYQYVNIDDCWENVEPDSKRHIERTGPPRDADGNILPNKFFPGMKAMTDYIHGKGLKAGIYSSPGPKTCAGFTASYQHEAQDAKQIADWGFDFLKYDWCSYGQVVGASPKLEDFKKPYQLMGDILKKQDRDIVFNLCQYGMGNAWEWAEEVGGNSWRTGGDLGLELDRMFAVALKNSEHRGWQRPGAWNDPDYIQIGYIGNAHGGGLPQPCSASPNEQYAFMSLWCLMAAPLFYSGDLSKLDDFTLNILCNPEVIDIDQDPLGECARPIPQSDEIFLMIKNLRDGSKALGLCNSSELEASITAKWDDIEVQGKQTVRDLWRQKDLGTFEREFKTTVPRHGVVLVRLTQSGN